MADSSCRLRVLLCMLGAIQESMSFEVELSRCWLQYRIMIAPFVEEPIEEEGSLNRFAIEFGGGSYTTKMIRDGRYLAWMCK